MLMIEEGKDYRAKNGERWRDAVLRGDRWFLRDRHDIEYWFENDGTFGHDMPGGEHSLAEEWIDEEIPDDILTTTFAPLEQLRPQQKNEAALRYDAGKSRISLIPPEFIEALGRHYGLGAQKYAERNWEKGMSWSRCYDSAQRHMLAFWAGEEADQETGTPHVIAAAWNMAALHWYALHGQGTDDRPK